MKARALVYVRKSMVRHRRDEISPERQLANCIAAGESHGWQVSDDDVRDVLRSQIESAE